MFVCTATKHNTPFADCEHQLKPVQSGFRLALIYNLVNAGSKSKRIIKDKSRVTAKIAEAVKQWGVTAKAPKRGIYMLSHKYGTPSPSFTCVCATPMDLTGLICVHLEQADAPSACRRSSTTSKQHSASPALSAKTDQLHACLV